MSFTLSDGTVIETGPESPVRLAGETTAPDAEAAGTKDSTASSAGTEAETAAASAEDETAAEGGAESAEAGTADETVEIVVDPVDPDGFDIADLLSAGLGALAGFVLAVLIFVVLYALGRRGSGPLRRLRKDPKQAAAPAGPRSITVEKLHEQGARNSQQDSFFVSDVSAADNLLVLVADGMGGLSDGDLVSQTAVSAAASAFYTTAERDPQRLLLYLVQAANTAVNTLLGRDGLYQSGSTFLAGLVRDGAFYYLSIGDSCIVLYRDGTLYQLNREHVYRNELYLRAVNEGGSLAGADSHPKAAGLSSFLGMGELKYIDIPAQPVEIHPGDRFVLMSDGVCNALSEAEMSEALAQPQAAGLLHTAIQAKNYQNQDNYTAVIMNC